MADIFSIVTGILAVTSAVKHSIEAVKRAKGAFQEQEDFLRHVNTFELTVRDVERSFEGNIELLEKCLDQSKAVLEEIHRFSIQILRSDGQRGLQARISAANYRRIVQSHSQTLQILRQELALIISNESLELQRASRCALAQIHIAVNQVAITTRSTHSVIQERTPYRLSIMQTTSCGRTDMRIAQLDLVGASLEPTALPRQAILTDYFGFSWVLTMDSGLHMFATCLDQGSGKPIFSVAWRIKCEHSLVSLSESWINLFPQPSELHELRHLANECLIEHDVTLTAISECWPEDTKLLVYLDNQDMQSEGRPPSRTWHQMKLDERYLTALFIFRLKYRITLKSNLDFRDKSTERDLLLSGFFIVACSSQHADRPSDAVLIQDGLFWDKCIFSNADIGFPSWMYPKRFMNR